jgi:effector-binding domain-containing protein
MSPTQAGRLARAFCRGSAGTVAATTHRGPHDVTSPAYRALTGWIQDHGDHLVRPPRVSYLGDSRIVISEDLLTEIYVSSTPPLEGSHAGGP